MSKKMTIMNEYELVVRLSFHNCDVISFTDDTIVDIVDIVA